MKISKLFAAYAAVVIGGLSVQMFPVVNSYAEIEYYEPWSEVVETGKCGENLNYELSATYVYKYGYEDPFAEYTLLITGSGDMYDWQEEEVPWGQYASNNNANSDGITTITLSDDITHIGNYAFYECCITEVTLPSKLVSIGNYSFKNCFYLNEIEFPDTLQFIGSYAFNNCMFLNSIIIPDSVQNIGSYCFQMCTSLEEVSLSNSIKTIEEYTFSRCVALKEINIPQNVTTIKERALSGCNALETVVLPDTLKKIEGWAFYCDSNLKSINIPEDIQYIDSYAFYGCSALVAENIKINYAISYLGGKAFPFDINFFYPVDINISDYANASLRVQIESLLIPNNIENEYSTVMNEFVPHSNIFSDSPWSRCERFFELDDSEFAYSDGSSVYVYRSKGSTVEQVLQLSIPNTTRFGAVCKDDKENYYILHFLNEEIDYSTTEGNTTPYVFVSKYNNEGQVIAQIGFNSFQTKGGIIASETGNPCISYNDGKVALLYTDLKNPDLFGAKHQGSSFILLSSDNLSVIYNPNHKSFTEGVEAVNPWINTNTSHSFEQIILPINGGFLLAQKGDGSPRAFKITKITDDLHSDFRDIIHFTDLPYESMPRYGYNQTYANLGGLAEGYYTYGFAGTSEQELSLTGFTKKPNEDVCVRIIHKTLTEDAENSINGEDRYSVGKHDGTELHAYLDDDGICDTKIIWLTSYENENAANVKIVSLDPGGYLVMWEKFDSENMFENAYYAILDDNGFIIKNPTILANARLPIVNQPIYNKDGIISWYTVENNMMKKYTINTNPIDFVIGDVNADGEFSIADVVTMQKYLLNLPDVTLSNWEAGDLCKDYNIDVLDLCIMKNEFLKINDI